jgi:hypothetical protein
MYHAFLFILAFATSHFFVPAHATPPPPLKTKDVPIEEAIRDFKAAATSENLREEYTLLLLELQKVFEVRRQVAVEIDNPTSLFSGNSWLISNLQSKIVSIGVRSLPLPLKNQIDAFLPRIESTFEKIRKKEEAENSLGEFAGEEKDLRTILSWVYFHRGECGKVKSYYISQWEKLMLAQGSEGSSSRTSQNLAWLEKSDVRTILKKCLSPSEYAILMKQYHQEN